MKSKQAARELGGTSNGKGNRKVIQLADTGLPPPFPNHLPSHPFLTSRCTCALNISFQLKRILRTPFRFSPLFLHFSCGKNRCHRITKTEKRNMGVINKGAYMAYTGIVPIRELSIH